MPAQASHAPIKNPNTQAAFPLLIAIAGILGPGVGLIVSGCGIQWAPPPANDALELAWVYANVVLAWTWLILWPAIRLGRKNGDRQLLAWDFLVLLVTAIPSLGVAAILSSVNGRMMAGMAAVQISLGLFAMGAMAWRTCVPEGLIAATLAAIGVILPVAGFVWSEFFLAASQAWQAAIPVVAVTRTAARAGNPWIAAMYALFGIVLFAIAPRAPSV